MQIHCVAARTTVWAEAHALRTHPHVEECVSVWFQSCLCRRQHAVGKRLKLRMRHVASSGPADQAVYDGCASLHRGDNRALKAVIARFSAGGGSPPKDGSKT